MRSIWQKQSGGLFRSECLILLCSVHIATGGAAGMSLFLFCLFTRFEIATRDSKCAAFGRNSPVDCFAASALYFCDRLSGLVGGVALFLRRCSTW